jgi:NADPH:quinone reductase-like Zn-dependent oxidoreductase
MVDWVFTTASLVAFVALAAVLAANERVRAWAAGASGRAWTRRVGVLAVLVGGVAAGSFSSSPPRGVLLFAAGGAVGFAAAALATAGAASAGVSAGGSVGQRVRAFWAAAAHEYRVTRYGLLVSGVCFLIAALTGGIAVDPTLSAVGAASLGGLLATVVGFGAVGAFVPGSGRPSAATDAGRAD